MNFRLLIVEDQKDVARTLARALQMRGFQTDVVNTCAEARAYTGSADCAVLDIDLPDGSGLDLARELVPSGKAKTALFFSGCADESIRTQARALGRFVPKSSGMHELAGSILASIKDAERLSTSTSAAFQSPAGHTSDKLKCS